MKRIVLLTLAAIMAGTIPNVPDAAPAPAPEAQQIGVFDRLRARRAARLGWFEDVAAAQEAPAPQPPPKAADKKFPRGAKPTPRFKLQAATPFKPARAAPAQFAIVPSKLSYWYNDTYGICVTSQEAFSKAMWSVQCGLPELFVPDAEVLRWASKYGFRDGANLDEVMTQMQRDGFNVGGTNFKDGPYFGVDYSNESILQSAIATGPVNIAIDADALPSGAGNQSGWFSLGSRGFPNTDHCVALCGYGPSEYLFKQLDVTLPSAIAGKSGYLLFTWNTVGFVDHKWLLNTCAEAWVRTPTTPGQSPIDPPPPPPPDPTGGITIQIPPGTAPGTYVIGGGGPSPLTDGEKAQLNALVAKVTGGTPTPPDPEPPASWNNDSGKILAQLGKAMRQKGGADGETAASLLEKNPDGHPVLARMLHRRLNRDADGQKLLAEYAAHGATPGWLTNLLDWLIKNGPALLAFIQTILKLFGL